MNRNWRANALVCPRSRTWRRFACSIRRAISAATVFLQLRGRRVFRLPVLIQTVSDGTFTSGWRILGELSSGFRCALLVEVPDAACWLWQRQQEIWLYPCPGGRPPMPSSNRTPSAPIAKCGRILREQSLRQRRFFVHVTSAATSLQFQNMLRQMSSKTVARVLPPTLPRSLHLDRVSSALAHRRDSRTPR